VTEEVLNLRQQLAAGELSQAEKAKLVERAAELAAENVSLRASVDELAAQKSALEDRNRAAEEEIKRK